MAGIGADLGLLLLGRLGAGAWSGIGPVETALLCAGLGFRCIGYSLDQAGRKNPAAVKLNLTYHNSCDTQNNLSSDGLSAVSGFIVTRCISLVISSSIVVYAIDLFKWPYDYDQGESFELYDAVLHSQGIGRIVTAAFIPSTHPIIHRSFT